MRRTMLSDRMVLSWLILVVFSITTAIVISSVRAERCDQGISVCSVDQFCDEHSYSCKSCKVICSDESLDCKHKCKDYLIASLKTSARTSTITIGVLSGVVAILLIVVFLLFLKLKRVAIVCPRLPWQTKNNATPTVAMTHENPNTKSPTRTPKNPANLTRQNTQQTTTTGTPDQDVENQTTITTVTSNRYPAEDSTEGLAYVNHACNVTPTSNGSAPRY